MGRLGFSLSSFSLAAPPAVMPHGSLAQLPKSMLSLQNNIHGTSMMWLLLSLLAYNVAALIMMRPSSKCQRDAL